MTREFDAIVFGASGFTGQYVVEEMVVSMENHELYKRDNLRWAVAGRNKQKIQKVLDNVADITKFEWVKQVPIIEANVEDYQSILEMCKKTRLIITVVGPYRFYGEPVVKGCVEASTHYVDISGEPQFLESMQLEYHNYARDKGIYIVSASGWDSIPADVGTTWTKSQFQGDLNGVDIIVSNQSPDGPKMNFGTWHSAIYGYAKSNELSPIRRKLYKDILPLPAGKSNFPHSRRPFLTYIDEVKGYCLPFPGCDRTVVKRSEVRKYNTLKERPLYCETYIRFGSAFTCIVLVMVMSVFGILSKFSIGRSLLKKYPGFFSLGVVSKDGVDREVLKRRTFSHTIIGYGWDEKYDDPDKQHPSNDPPKKKIVTRVSGPDAGYIGTAILLVHSGMTLLFDKEKLPEPGVITPGACFRDTYLVDRLTKRGIKFEVLERF